LVFGIKRVNASSTATMVATVAGEIANAPRPPNQSDNRHGHPVRSARVARQSRTGRGRGATTTSIIQSEPTWHTVTRRSGPVRSSVAGQTSPMPSSETVTCRRSGGDPARSQVSAKLGDSLPFEQMLYRFRRLLVR
jgi:hypothetical protein